MNIRFEAILADQPQWMLARLRALDLAAHATILRCISLLEQDPYPDSVHIDTLAIPHQQGFQHAFRCHDWRIAFHVEDHAFVVIDQVYRKWPPVDPSLQTQR